MRQTLTVISILIAAASLAACKKFWEHDPPPPAAATATTAPATPDRGATTDAAKPLNTPSAPATK